MFIVHPREPKGPLPDRDYVYMLSEWKIVPGTRQARSERNDRFQYAHAECPRHFLAHPPYARQAWRASLRLPHRKSVHDRRTIRCTSTATPCRVIATDGGPLPEAGQSPEITVLVPVGSTRTVEIHRQ